MTSHFKILGVLFLFLVSFTSTLGFVTNSGGAFTVSFDSQNAVVVNSNIETTFFVTVENNLEIDQDIEFNFEDISGWDIIMDDSDFTLESGESRIVDFTIRSNSNFDYSENVVSSDTIKIGRNEDYRGFFEFPLLIESSQDDVSLVFQVEVVREEDLRTSYVPRLSSGKVSPANPISFTVEAQNISSEHQVVINSNLGDYNFEPIIESFDLENNYKVFTLSVDSSIDPGFYDAKITVREESTQGSAREWYLTQRIEVVPYSKISVEKENNKGLLIDSTTLSVSNEGNIDETYVYALNHSYIKNLFFTTQLSTEETQNGVNILIPMESGEEKVVSYAYNYVGLYIFILLVIFVAGYIYYRKASNPFEVETKIYEVKRDVHEGIKSMKVRIGFENIKVDEIETIKVIFRMPAYLKVQEESFLLTPPNHVLKGKTQYKLEWNFKKFEKNDSRILGFSLVNSKGILGDIRFKDLEFEIKIKGNVKKYYTSLPIVKG